jgi:hypothetical protein
MEMPGGLEAVSRANPWLFAGPGIGIKYLRIGLSKSPMSCRRNCLDGSLRRSDDFLSTGVLQLEDASLGILMLKESRLAGITANRANLSGTVFLENGFVDGGEVSFFGADICGGLSCGGSKIRPREGQDGLICTGVKVGGDIVLNDGFECEGRVVFERARIGGNIDLSGASISGSPIKNENGDVIGIGQAINADNAEVGGWFSIGGGFVAKGKVSLKGAEISSDLCFSGSTFENPGRESHAIQADGSIVSGSIFFPANRR